MKKNVLLIVAISALLITMAYGAQAPLKFWQDVLRKPTQAWRNAYGHREDSVLAYNVRSILEVQDAMANEVVALRAIVDAHLKDPNEVE